ncbi:MAG: Uma2 family endonuclease [Deltaproteobacteria bacterium]|nr:Uma2 family endonuclease [Deltaproteobacteria bacterium]
MVSNTHSSGSVFVPLPVPADDPNVDQRMLLHGVTWRDYLVLRELLDGPGLRMTYLNGVLEFMSPSRKHEGVKTRLARLLELYALELDIPLFGYGSTTFRHEAQERGLEPDECYVVGRDMAEFPDIALEVAVTAGGLNRLEVYRPMGVKEVWFWFEGSITVYVLEDGGYRHCARSSLLPDLDLKELAQLADQEDQHAALKEYRRRLREFSAH